MKRNPYSPAENAMWFTLGAVVLAALCLMFR